MFYQVISISVPCKIALVGFRQFSSRNTYLHIIQTIISNKFNNFIINNIYKFARILLRRNRMARDLDLSSLNSIAHTRIRHRGILLSGYIKHTVTDASRSVVLNKWLLEMRYIIHKYRSTTSWLVGWLYLTSHRQQGREEFAKDGFYTVPTGNRTPCRCMAVHYTTAAPPQLLPDRDGPSRGWCMRCVFHR